MDFIVILIIFFVLFMFVISSVIRGAVDSSKATKKMDVLIDEVRLLRKEIQENKPIIDKRL
ncbi:hypothetical protein [Paenibacillus harenae]|uniref:hypothetical protein n=1 Tax=Paenibacillus harenae TaxID=306543 RepID=UPI0003F8A439|nr:hypothetical protein [Paenibacillus harenae]